jgi:hypothetical protein
VSLDVELLGHRGLAADQTGQIAEVGQLVAVRDDAEPLLALVRDPEVAVRQVGQVLAQLLDVGLRVVEVPDEDADDQKGPRGS